MSMKSEKNFNTIEPYDESKMESLVYRIADDTIHIADFWDTRREPQKQAQQLKDNESEILES